MLETLVDHSPPRRFAGLVPLISLIASSASASASIRVQLMNLYEVSRTLAVHGIWNVFAADGRPRWLYLDGCVVDASGPRELLVHEYAMQPCSG